MKTSSDDSTTRQLTVRLPRRLYDQTQRMARARRVSVNALVRRLLEELEREERERELGHAYEILGSDAAGNDAEPYFRAQSEVVRRG